MRQYVRRPGVEPGSAPCVGVCVRCGRTELLQARRLCPADYSLGRDQGWLDDYPRQNRTINDFAEDFQLLRERGLSRAEIATHMGYQRSSLCRLLTRARQAGLIARGRVCAA